MGRAVSYAAVVTPLLLALCCAPQRTPGQVQLQARNVAVNPPKSEFAGQPLFITEREMSRAFADAEEFVSRGEYQHAVRRLQHILDRDEDLFYQPNRHDRAHFRSLKGEAQRLIASLPDEGREEYERAYGHAARGVLDEAEAAGDVGAIAEVARRYFHTRAGYDATFWLAAFHFDRGESLAAAMRLELLRDVPSQRAQREPMLSLKAAVAWGRAGLPEQAVRTLLELKERSTDGRITLAGRLTPLFDTDDEALPWLAATLGRQPEFATLREEAWTLFRGNAARNAAGTEASPLWDEQWRYSTLQDRDATDGVDHIAESLKELEERYRAGGLLTLPAAHPLVLGDVAVVRTIKDVRAIDLRDGSLAGETVRPDPPYQEFVLPRGDDAAANRNANSLGSSPRETLLAQRSWRDLTAGTLSSDGRHVYAIEDLGFLGFPYLNARVPDHPLAPKDYNTLSAFDAAADLKLDWEAGGPRERGLPAAGAYFLGPPLPLGGELYCLAEDGGEIRLVVLDPSRRGRVVWAQRLVYPPESLARDPRRRLAGLSPAYADGVMVCPTGAGAVVAVDLSRRILHWGYQYPTTQPEAPTARRAVIRRQMMGHGSPIVDDEDGWLDSVPTIADGRAVLAPGDSNDLHCLNLVDGTSRWRRPRGQGLYVAGVFQGKVVVVGRNQVEAWNLDDGSPAWPDPLPVPTPSGRGFRSGRHYYLPLSSGDILTIDLEQGRMLARSRLPDGEVPGNLITAGGMLLSQSADALVALRPIGEVRAEIAVALAASPGDTVALERRAELALHAGQIDDGLEDLERLRETGASPRATELLAATLLEGLRLDFDRYRDRADEIEELLVEPELRGRFLRLYAEGLDRAGDRIAAFASYLRLADLESAELPVEEVQGSLLVRSDRWVRPRIAALYHSASSDERAVMDRMARERLDAALAQDGPDAIRRLVHCFGALPIAGQARLALVERLSRENDALELELVLEELANSEDSTLVASATAQRALLFIDRGRLRDAAPLLESLSGRWRDVVCYEGKTGGQLVADLLEDEGIAEEVAGVVWPEGTLSATVDDGGGIDRMYPLDFVGRPGPYYEYWNLAIDARRQNIIAADGYGREQWRLPIVETGRSVYTQYGNTVRVRDHLMVLVLGNYLAVIDPFSRPDKPRVLWHQDLYEKTGIDGTNRGVNQQQFMERGVKRVVLTDGVGRPLGTLGLITRDAVLIQVGSELTAADPLTGDVLWLRRNVPREGAVFGDEELVFVVAPNSTQATVLRAADGETVGTCAVPTDEERILTVGRRVIAWRELDSTRELSCLEPWTGEVRWRREFPLEAQIETIKGEEIAVLDPAGRITVLSVPEGEVRVDSAIDGIEELTYFHVRRTRDRYILLTQGAWGDPDGNAVVQIQPIGFNAPVVTGTVHGFDRETGTWLWGTDVGRHTVELSQPDGLPVLILSSRIFRFEQQGNIRRASPNQYTLLVLDTRNGQIVHRPEEGRNDTSRYEVEGDPETGRIEVQFTQMTLSLHADEEPLEAPKATARAGDDSLTQ